MELSRRDILRIAGIANNRVYTGPKKVNIHINNYCNLNCMFCWYHSPLVTKRPIRKRNFDYGLLKQVIDDCALLNVEVIDLEGEGEVLLYPHINELLRYIKSKNIKVMTYTNALLHNFDITNLRYIDYLNINFSAASPEIYATVHSHRKSAFEQALKNLNSISKIKKAIGKPSVTISFILNELNFHELGSILLLAEKLGFERVNFKMFEATQETKKLLLKNSSIRKVLDKIEDLIKKHYNVQHNLNEIYDILKNNLMKKKYAIQRSRQHNDRLFYFQGCSYKEHGCYAGWFFAYIDLSKRVIAPCDNVGIANVGRVDKKRFKDIWFSDEYQKIRQEAKNHLDLNKKKWQECRYCHNISFNKSIAALVAKKIKKF